MKKSFVFIAMLAIAPALFAEDETVSCESDLGQCTYTLSAESFSVTCVCRDGSASGEDGTAAEDGTLDFTLPTEEECKAELESVCKNLFIVDALVENILVSAKHFRCCSNSPAFFFQSRCAAFCT